MAIEIKDIQVLALLAVEDPDSTATYRHICRWYSKEFSTPLAEVEQDLLEIEVLRHYYEDHYSKLYEDQSEAGSARYQNLRYALLRDGKDAVIEEVREQEDDDWAKEMVEQIQKEADAAAAKVAKALEKRPDPITEKAVDISRKGE